MSTDRQALIVKLREREQDLRAACEYVGGGVKGVIFAEVAENTRDAADALEQAETELSSLRERVRELLPGFLFVRTPSKDLERYWMPTADLRKLAALVEPKEKADG